MVTVVNGMHNPHRLEVGKDITHAIIKTSATPSCPSTYWSQEEQEERLIAAYEKWTLHGGVWSAASIDVSPKNSEYLPVCRILTTTHLDTQDGAYARTSRMSRTKNPRYP